MTLLAKDDTSSLSSDGIAAFTLRAGQVDAGMNSPALVLRGSSCASKEITIVKRKCCSLEL